jgi:hypothetical protein
MGQLTIYLPDATEKAVKAAARRAKKSVSAWIAQLAEGDRRARARWPRGYEKVLGSWEGDFPELDDPPPGDVIL